MTLKTVSFQWNTVAIDCDGNAVNESTILFLLQEYKNHQLRRNHPEKHC